MRFRVHWLAFWVAFSVVMVHIYFVAPPPKIVVKHPTPFNAGQIVYEDAAGTCFVFDAIEVKKKGDEKVKKQPIVEKFLNEVRVRTSADVSSSHSK